MTGASIRARFLSFFQNHGHERVASSSLIPQNDPTLLFTNAGMNQFKGVFLGEEHRSYDKAVSSQKCVRAGGKHNDLENVGRTARHHTFFEMLGNFSFGNYFKDVAISLAWTFVTQDLGLPVERLLVTVFAEDDEAYDIWVNKVGIAAEKVIRIATSDNFWSMGATGPCGPCSEIFYDYGPEIPGGPPGSADQDGDRFVEIWNLVFMQYNREADGTLNRLPNPCIDTGAGLERLACILQGKTNNYASDLFQPLIKAVAAVARVSSDSPDHVVSLRVIADHLRSVSFLIADGVLPANEGRGYVLRRIMRRAMRHGRLLGLEKPFLHRLVGVLVQQMGDFFPELVAQQKTIILVIETEEKRFIHTLGAGLKILEEVSGSLAHGDRLDGATVFSLYDTYGFPVDLTADILLDRGITLDMAGFELHMAKQRTRARAAWSGSGDEKIAAIYHELRERLGATEFLGYATDHSQGTVQAILVDGSEKDLLVEGEKGQLVVNQTPFYGESGGQVGDTGVISAGSMRFTVADTRKMAGNVIVHQGAVVVGQIKLGDSVILAVDGLRRMATRRHHSATHFLHYALRHVLGDHVKQAGSLVAPERLRFDFSHFQALTAEEIGRVEGMVNEAILQNDQQETTIMTPDEAMAAGAMALFGEKYGDDVRVVRIGPTLELCGGIHVSRSGDVGLLRILGESAVAAGMRRIEAVCGLVARESFHKDVTLLRQAASLMKVAPSQIVEGVERLLDRQRVLEQELDRAKVAMVGNVVDGLVGKVRDVGGISLLAERVEGIDPKDLRDLLDQVKNKLVSGVILLGVPEKGKVSLIAGVSHDLSSRVRAGDLMHFVAPQVGGKGGGRPDMAMGGGVKPEQLNAALASVSDWIKEKAQCVPSK